jgi:hypothetical protein
MDLRALSRQILLNPRSAANNELVALLELEKPGLQFLCPMARAIYLIETERVEQIDASEALNTIWFADDSDSYKNEDDGDVTFEESARHAIELSWSDIKIILGFESNSRIFYHQKDLYPGKVRAHSAVTSDFGPHIDSSALIRILFDRFEAE